MAIIKVLTKCLTMPQYVIKSELHLRVSHKGYYLHVRSGGTAPTTVTRGMAEYHQSFSLSGSEGLWSPVIPLCPASSGQLYPQY